MKGLTRDEAIEKANEYIAEAGDEYALDLDHVIEFDEGFCFGWNTKAYLASGDLLEMAVGPAHFIVPHDGSAIFCLGSAYSPERLIEEYKNR